MRTTWFQLKYRRFLLRCESTAQIGRAVIVASHGVAKSVSIGDRVTICDGVVLETGVHGKIIIAEDVWISRFSVISAQKLIVIERGALVGEFCSIRDANHGIALNNVPIRQQPFDVAPVTIGEDCWIGRGVAVLKGATVGEGAVIGANAVVSRDIPPNAIAVGIPAVVARYRS